MGKWSEPATKFDYLSAGLLLVAGITGLTALVLWGVFP